MMKREKGKSCLGTTWNSKSHQYFGMDCACQHRGLSN